MFVDEIGAVNGGKWDGLMDQQGHPTSPTAGARTVDEVVAWKRDFVVVFSLGFLKSDDADAAVDDEVAKVVGFVVEAVAIPLQERRERRRRLTRAQVRVDTVDVEDERSE